MNIINATIQELCQAGKTPSEFCTNVKTCVSRALKRLKDTSSNLPKVQNTSSRRERTKNSSKTKKKIQKKPKKKHKKIVFRSWSKVWDNAKCAKKLCLKPYKKTKCENSESSTALFLG